MTRRTVIVKKRGPGYIATVHNTDGSGPQGARIGLTPQDAATRAAELMLEWCQESGGDLLAPDEVMQRIPEHLRRLH